MPIIDVIIFDADEMAKTVNIQIIDDTSVESDENFFLSLTSGAGVYLSPFSRAEVIISSDDGKNIPVLTECVIKYHSRTALWKCELVGINVSLYL